MAAAAILNWYKSKIAPLDPPSPKTPPYNNTWSGSDDRLRRYGHLKFFQDGGGRHLGFVRTENSAITSAVPENPALEQNMKWIGRPVAEISPLEIFPTCTATQIGSKPVGDNPSKSVCLTSIRCAVYGCSHVFSLSSFLQFYRGFMLCWYWNFIPTWSFSYRASGCMVTSL